MLYLNQQQTLNKNMLQNYYQVVLKTGKTHPSLYVNVQTAIKKIGAENIKKIIELREELVNVKYIENPISWMPSQWPKNVKFVSCSFDGNIIDPKKKVITENLYISGRYSSKVKINMEKFPNLKELILL